MPPLVYEIIDLLAAIVRFLGLAVFGLGVGYLAVDLLRRAQWPVQVAVFLGLLGLVIALTVFSAWGATGAFALGVGGAVFVWGMPKAPKDEAKKK
jgi:hypothetical protein